MKITWFGMHAMFSWPHSRDDMPFRLATGGSRSIPTSKLVAVLVVLKNCNRFIADSMLEVAVLVPEAAPRTTLTLTTDAPGRA